MSLILPIAVGCKQNNYAGFILLTDDNTSVTLTIPVEFLSGNNTERVESSVWLSFSYPDMKPTKTPNKLANGISILILNIANRKTRAEYFYYMHKVSFDRNSDTDVKESPTSIKETTITEKDDSGETRYIYERTPDGYVIFYKTSQGLKISASRRFSKNIELRYVIPENLFNERHSIDSAIVSLVNTFKNESK